MAKEKTEIEKLDLNSMNVAEEKQKQILRLFPEIHTEGGKIDFDKLKLALGESIDSGKERYGMNWPGKTECFKTIQTASMGTLLPQAKESVDFDNTEHLMIEGDNLEVLKLLQKAYLGTVKLIYIDPPYNTGNDFIYPDNFTESLTTYLQYTSQIDSEGRRFGTNAETDGRFHSKWLNMIFPRLYLARNLLKRDGVILVSIDDTELQNLRSALDIVFGEENFIGSFVWQGGRKNDARLISQSHDYIVVYARDQGFLREKDTRWREKKDGLEQIYSQVKELRARLGNNYKEMHTELLKWYRELPEGHPSKANDHFNYVDDRGVYFPDNLRSPNPRPNLVYQWKGYSPHPNGWAYGPERMAELDREDRLVYPESKDQRIKIKSYLHEHEDWAPGSVFYKDRRSSSKALTALMGADVFDFPKDPDVISRLIGAIAGKEGIVLDFFAGSGTTAQAVLERNCTYDSNLKFILVQLPEPVPSELGYKTISDITKERIRRVCSKLKSNIASQLPLSGTSRDLGFRVFKLADSNFKGWNPDARDKATLVDQLELHVEHVRIGRTAADLLYEILLKSGFPLTTKVETHKFDKQTFYSIAAGMLLVCLEDNLTLDLIKHIAEQKPERVVCLDHGFANNDQLKANAVQIFRTKGIASFKTV